MASLKVEFCLLSLQTGLMGFLNIQNDLAIYSAISQYQVCSTPQVGIFFCKLCAPEHSLHHLLPPLTKCNNLRDCGHPCELAEFRSSLHKKPFIVRALYLHV